VAVAPILVSSTATASLLYAVDFNDDVVGQAPLVDTGPFPREGPSEIRTATETSRGFGEPEVVAAFGALDDQPAVFSTDLLVEPYIPTEKLGFALGLNESAYRLDFDLVIEFLDPAFPFGDSFSVLLDGAPGFLRNLTFRTDGTITLFPNQGGGPGVDSSYTAGDELHITMIARFDTQRLSLLIDEELIFTTAMVGADIEKIRFVLQDADGDGLATAGRRQRSDRRP